MTVEVYESVMEESVTVVVADDERKMDHLEEDAKLIRTIEGEDWNDCMRQHHEIMGWEPYKPF